MEEKEARAKEIESAVEEICEIIPIATKCFEAVSELQGYLEYSLNKFNLPKTEEEEIKEVERFIEEISPNLKRQEEIKKEIQSGTFNHAKFSRESGVERKINFLIFIGLLHHQEDFLKGLGASKFFFKKDTSKGLTLGRLLKRDKKNSINNAFNFKHELYSQSFYSDLTECNNFCNSLKHNEWGAFKSFVEINQKLIHIYIHSIYGYTSYELRLSARAFLRYVDSFKNFWIYIYSKIEEKLNSNKEKIRCRETSDFNDNEDYNDFLEMTVKYVDELENKFYQAKNNLEESMKKQMPG